MQRMSAQTERITQLLLEKQKTEQTKLEEDNRQFLNELRINIKNISDHNVDIRRLLENIVQDREDKLQMAESADNSRVQEWQPIQIDYVAGFLDKCVSRINMHEESTRYYERRHYYIIIPATALGLITSTAAFTQWTDEVLCGEVNSVWIIVGLLMALTTLLHNLSEHVFGFKDKARQHHQSYINFSRLVKRIGNELNNPDTDHKPYRQFIESISEDYNRYTEHALMIPSAVDKMLRDRWLEHQKVEHDNNDAGNANQTNNSNNVVDNDILDAQDEQQIVQNTGVGTAIDIANVTRPGMVQDVSHVLSPPQTAELDTLNNNGVDQSAQRIKNSIAAFQQQRNRVYASNKRQLQFQKNADLVEVYKSTNSLAKNKSEKKHGERAQNCHGAPPPPFSVLRSRNYQTLPKQSADGHPSRQAPPLNDVPFDSLIELNMISTTSSSPTVPTTSTNTMSTSATTASPNLPKQSVGRATTLRKKVRQKRPKKHSNRRKREQVNSNIYNNQTRQTDFAIDADAEEDYSSATPDEIVSVVSGMVTFDDAGDSSSSDSNSSGRKNSISS